MFGWVTGLGEWLKAADTAKTLSALGNIGKGLGGAASVYGAINQGHMAKKMMNLQQSQWQDWRNQLAGNEANMTAGASAWFGTDGTPKKKQFIKLGEEAI